jgi:chemotaxis protein histidine kinase CheA
VSGVLARHWQEIFMDYKNHVDVVMSQLDVEETKLQRYLGPWLELDKRIEAFRKFYQENELERQAFRKRMEEKIREQGDQFKEQIEQLKAEMKEKAKVQEEREKVQEEKAQEQAKQIKEQGEKINKLTQLVEQLVAHSSKGDQVQEEAAANEANQSTQRFFKL